MFRKINVSNNDNCNIYDNQFADKIVNNNFLYPSAFEASYTDVAKINFELRNSSIFNDIYTDSHIISDSLLRHQKLNESIKKLTSYSNKNFSNPILRIYGCFTSLSTIRQPSESSDLAKLELEEKDSVINFIKSGFQTKVIVTLDQDMIFGNNIYTIEQYKNRCNDFTKTLFDLSKYDNLDIAIDYGNSMESMYILDTILICQLPILLFDSKRITYGHAIFNCEADNISQYINTFDRKFSYLKRENCFSRKVCHHDKFSDFFKNVCQSRCKV